MPYDLKFARGGFFLRLEGQTSIDEINEVNGLLNGHARFDDHRFQLIDVLDADFSQVEIHHARVPGAYDSAAALSRERVRIAMVVVEPHAVAFHQEYVKTALKLGSGWRFRIFGEREAAESWVLGIA